jgi:hypothetical protein
VSAERGRNRRVGASPDLCRLAARSLSDHAGVAGELQSRRTVGSLGYFGDQLTAAPLKLLELPYGRGRELDFRDQLVAALLKQLREQSWHRPGLISAIIRSRPH